MDIRLEGIKIRRRLCLSTAAVAPPVARRTAESKPIHRVIPKHAARPCSNALTCDSAAAAYPTRRSVAFGSAECDHRQGQMGLGAAAATGVASHGGFDPGSKLRVAARGTCRAGASSPVMFLGSRSDQCGETAAHSRASGNPAFGKDWVPAFRLRAVALRRTRTRRSSLSERRRVAGTSGIPIVSNSIQHALVSAHGHSDQSPAIHHRMGPLRSRRYRL